MTETLHKPDLPLLLRPGRDDDSDGCIALVAAAFAEYPGCILDVDAEEPILRAPASGFAELGGAFWVVELAGQAVAMVGAHPIPREPGGWELRKLYVQAGLRSRGLGRALIGRVETHTLSHGGNRVELWSDTRFTRAHRLYELLGYERGETRHLYDLSDTVEYHYVRRLNDRSWACA